tara:strand:- start:920 stop:1270 length:351 start_codon:yes stop_codon:yes gene_type:complete
MEKMDDHDNYIVEKNIIRYKFVIALFILSIIIFHPELINYMKEFLDIKSQFFITIVHSILFSFIVYLMLYFSGDSFVLSPCNVDLNLQDYIYYFKKNNIVDSIEIIDDEDNTEIGA